MDPQIEQSEKDQNHSPDNIAGRKQAPQNTTVQFVDKRSETNQLQHLQNKINNSPKAKQLKAFQTLANQSPQHEQITQLQAAVDQTPPLENIIQKKENKTGLPNQLKSGIEQLSGYSMDDVKVHYNSDKPAQLQAHAYAQGTNIHLGAGQEKHLPHEAWHVVQQKAGRVKQTTQLKGIAINDDAGLEKEADVMGQKAAQLQPADTEAATTTNQGRLSTTNTPAQRVRFGGEWENKSNKYPTRKRQEIKAGLIEKYDILEQEVAKIKHLLRGIQLPGNSELGNAFAKIYLNKNPYIEWNNREAYIDVIDKLIKSATQFISTITDFIAKIPIAAILRMQDTKRAIKVENETTSTNRIAGNWARRNARRPTIVPSIGGGQTDISSLLALRNSTDSSKNKNYRNTDGFFVRGSYTELVDTKGSIPGWRVILNDRNRNVYWAGYGMTHGGKTIYYWNGARWEHWVNKAGQAYPQEAQSAVPVVPAAAKNWLKDNSADLNNQLDKAANPTREEKRRRAAEQRAEAEAARIAKEAAEAEAEALAKARAAKQEEREEQEREAARVQAEAEAAAPQQEAAPVAAGGFLSGIANFFNGLSRVIIGGPKS